MTNVVRVKPGVVFGTIAPAGMRIIEALNAAARVLRADLEITCGTEGHAAPDPHVSGEAYDVSVKGLDAGTVSQLVQYLRNVLGPAFYLQYETPAPPVEPALRAIAVVNPRATAPHVHVQRRNGTVYPAPAPSVAVQSV